MGQRDYLAIIRRNWVIILLLTLIGGGGALAVTARTTPIYTATSTMLFTISSGNTANELSQGSTYTQNQMLSYAILATTPSTLDPVIEELDLDADAERLAGAVNVSAPADTSILEITASSIDPQTAADIANSVASSLADQVDLFAPSNAAGISTVSAQTVAEASAPAGPSSPNVRRNIAAGLILGLLAGILVAVLRDVLDTRIRTEEGVARVSSVPVLGSVERDPDFAQGGLATLRDPSGPSSESYRSLRTGLQFAAVDSESLTLVITSSLPNEGKSTVSSNLAVAIAEAEQSVILVDADLRRGSIADYNGLEASVGLTTVLLGRATLDDVIQIGGHPSLHVLASGDLPPNPSSVLSSKALGRLIDELKSRYDVVIIDAAPMLAVADAAVLSQFVDGVMVVADVTQVRRRHLAQTLDGLERAGASVLGVVLNKVKSPDRVSYYGRDSGARATPKSGSGPRESAGPADAPSATPPGDAAATRRSASRRV